MDILFFLNERNITVLDNRAENKVVKEEQIEWHNQDALTDYLKQIPNDTVSAVILDFVDENIEPQWVAKLLPWEKKDFEQLLIKKSLGDNNGVSNVTWLPSFQKNSDGRQEQEVRVVSMPFTDAIAEFFAALEKYQQITPYIYSNTFLVGSLFSNQIKSRLRLNKQQVNANNLLIVKEASHVFRQVFLTENRIKFSRLIYLDTDIENDIAISYALLDETKLFIKYLYNQKTVPYNDPIGLVYLDEEGDIKEEVMSQYHDSIVLPSWQKSKMVIGSFNFSDIASKGYLPEQAKNFRDTIASYLFHKRPHTFYRTPYTQKITNILKGAQSLKAAAAIFLLLGLISLGMLWVDRTVIESENTEIKLSILNLNAEKKRIQAEMKLQHDAEDIREIVLFSKQILEENALYNQRFNLKGIAQVLSNHPNIRLTQLKWGKRGVFDASQISVVLSGLVFPFEEAYEQPLFWTDQLVEDIKKLPEVRNVVLSKEPIDRRLSESILVDKGVEEVNALPFEIDFDLGPEPVVKDDE